MSDLKTRLLEDFKTALKEKDLIRKDVIQTCRAAVLQVEKDKLITLDESGVLDVLNKEWKKRQDSLSMVGEARPDFAEKLRKEMQIIESYLPAKLSVEEITEIVKQEIAKLGVSSMKEVGVLMKNLMPLLKDKADGKTINEVVKSLLN